MNQQHRSPDRRRGLRVLILGLVGLALCSSGCAALTNPVAQGIPVQYLPDEVLGESRSALKPIPFILLGQEPPEVYQLAPGDVLGIVIESVLGERNAPPPVHLDVEKGPPAMGYPVPVREDGTIVLPYIKPVQVAGKSLIEVQELLRQEYTVKKEILKEGTERILVTLMRPRRYHVMVMREDGGTAGVPVGPGLGFGIGASLVGESRKGTGVALDLPAYQNDVLNALTRSGGLPGTDARNEVIIQRKLRRGDRTPKIIRIPLRLRPGEPVPFMPEDVILNDGDTVIVEAREAEVFYTAGLLGSGQFPLPRDYDLNVLQAIATVRGPLINGSFNQSAFGGSATGGGIGSPNPSLVTVLRQTSKGTQIPIRVDLNLAFQDPRERLLIQPGDIIVMQETTSEALTRYFTNVFSFNLTSPIVNEHSLQGTATATVP